MGVVLIKHKNESKWTLLLGYVTISKMLDAMIASFCNNFVIQQDSALVHLAFNTVQMLQCETLNFLSRELTVQLNSTYCEI